MSSDGTASEETVGIPSSAAEAWAAVYIDVAEKLDAEAQEVVHVKQPETSSDPTQIEREDRMSKFLTGEADLDFPVPNAERVAAQLRVMRRDGTAATTQAVAKEFGVSVGAITAVLQRAQRAGLVAFTSDQGWIAT